MRWLASEASGFRGARCPRMCRWRYYDDAPDYRTGMGEGNAGIVHAFDTFAQRTGKRWLERYALGGARFLESRISRHGAMPGGTPSAEAGRPSSASSLITRMSHASASCRPPPRQ